MSEIVKCIADSLQDCVENRKLIKIDNKRVAVTINKNKNAKGKTFLVAIFVQDIPILTVRKLVKVGASNGFVLTSPFLRKLADMNIRVKVCYQELENPSTASYTDKELG